MSFFCYFFATWLSFFCIFLTILLSFLFHLFVIFFSFSHPARVAGSGAELEIPKTQFHQHAGHFFCHCFVILVVFSSGSGKPFSHPDQASGEGGKPGLGNAKKCKKNDSRFGKCKKDAKKK